MISTKMLFLHNLVYEDDCRELGSIKKLDKKFVYGFSEESLVAAVAACTCAFIGNFN
jgi:hypothetical protein